MLLFFFTLLNLCLCYDDLQIILLNSPQTYTLFSRQHTITLQVPANFSLGIGQFNFSLIPVDPQESPNFLLSRQKCESDLNKPTLLFSSQSFSSRDISTILFHANASESQCFKIQVPETLERSSTNFTVLATFKSADFKILPNQTLNYELKGGSETLFSCDFQDQPEELFLITIQANFSFNNSHNITLGLRQNTGTCIHSQHNVPAPGSWLCGVIQSDQLIVFSVFNHGDSGTFQLTINKVKPREVNADTEAVFYHSLPGFGSIFVVNLSDAGILKIKAQTIEDKPISILTSNSLPRLFGGLKQDQNLFNAFEVKLDQQGNTLIQNKHVNTCWYHFIPELEPKEPFLLISEFIKQMTIEVNTQAEVFIDPEIYEYQYIRLRLGSKDFLEKYEAVLSAQQPDSPMNLYYDSSFHEISSISQDQSFFVKKASSRLVNESQISLSFIVGSYDSPVYLIIHAGKKGYYQIRFTKVDPIASLQIIFAITVVTYVAIYFLSCFFKIYRLSRISQNLSDSRGEQVPENNSLEDVDLEIEVRSVEIAVATEKLKKQKEIECVMGHPTSQQHGQPDNNLGSMNSKSLNEDEVCYICYENKKTVRFQPCNHTCACVYCALAIVQTSPKCPLCREQIIEVETTFNVGKITQA